MNTLSIKTILKASLVLIILLITTTLIYHLGKKPSYDTLTAHQEFFASLLPFAHSIVSIPTQNIQIKTHAKIKNPGIASQFYFFSSGVLDDQASSFHSFFSAGFTYATQASSGFALAGSGEQSIDGSGMTLKIQELDDTMARGQSSGLSNIPIQGQKIHSSSSKKYNPGQFFVFIYDLSRVLGSLSGGNFSGFETISYGDTKKRHIALSHNTGSVNIDSEKLEYEENFRRSIPDKNISYVVIDKITGETTTISGKTKTINKNGASVVLLFEGEGIIELQGLHTINNEKALIYDIDSEWIVEIPNK